MERGWQQLALQQSVLQELCSCIYRHKCVKSYGFTKYLPRKPSEHHNMRTTRTESSVSHQGTLINEGISFFELCRFPNTPCFPSDPEDDPEQVLGSYFSSRKWFIRASRDAREHLLSQRDSLEGFRVHGKGVMAVSTRICEPVGVPQPFTALGVYTKTSSNGEI